MSKKRDIRRNPQKFNDFGFKFSASLALIGHPFGSLLSGSISVALGRRRALLMVVAPAILAFIVLGCSDSFFFVCLSFFSLSFIFGLKDAPSMIYISEMTEPSARGALLAFIPIARYSGQFIVYFLGSFFAWRQVAFTCAAVPVIVVFAICFVRIQKMNILATDFVHLRSFLVDSGITKLVIITKSPMGC